MKNVVTDVQTKKGLAYVVDDEEQIRRLLYQTLTKKAGLNVEVAESGNKAIELMKKRLPDVIYLDMIMPDGTGLDVMRWLADNNYCIPTFISTGTQFSHVFNQAASLLDHMYAGSQRVNLESQGIIRVGQSIDSYAVLGKPYPLKELLDKTAEIVTAIHSNGGFRDYSTE